MDQYMRLSFSYYNAHDLAIGAERLGAHCNLIEQIVVGAAAVVIETVGADVPPFRQHLAIAQAEIALSAVLIVRLEANIAEHHALRILP